MLHPVLIGHAASLTPHQVDALRKEFTIAQGEVLSAAKAHVQAAQQLKAVTAANLAAQSRLSSMREEDTRALQAQLRDARRAQLHASSRFEAANTRMEGVRARRTRLQVRVARLELQLKQARLQRDTARRHRWHTWSVCSAASSASSLREGRDLSG